MSAARDGVSADTCAHEPNIAARTTEYPQTGSPRLSLICQYPSHEPDAAVQNAALSLKASSEDCRRNVFDVGRRALHIVSSPTAATHTKAHLWHRGPRAIRQRLRGLRRG